MNPLDAEFFDLVRPYAADVPTGFQRLLLQRLTPPAATRPLRHWRRAIAAAVAASLAIAIPLILHYRSPKPPPRYARIGREAAPPPPTLVAHDAPPQIPTMLGLLTLDAQMSRAPLIVRTRVTNITGWRVEFTLTRIILGHTDNKSFTLDVTFGIPSLAKSYEDNAREKFLKDNHRDPAPDELYTAALLQQGISLDRQVILMLEPADKPGDYRSLGMQFDVPPEHTLDNAEKEMMRVIEAGSYLAPVSYTGDVFTPQVASAAAIVRAKLLQITPKDARWQILRTAKGALTTDTVTIDHSRFHDRAEALINYAALTDPSLRSDPKRSAAIQSKINDLLKSDLTPGREAILFLGPFRVDGPPAATTHAPLQHILYSQDNGKNLDQLETLLQAPEQVPNRM